MRKMVRKISLTTVVVMMLLCLYGCGGTEQSRTNVEDGSTKISNGTNDENQSIAAKYREKEEERQENYVYEYTDDCAETNMCEETAAEVYSETSDSVSNDADTYYYDTSYDDDYLYYEGDYDTREYDYVDENKFVSASDEPLSTFSADRDTASYSIIRSYIEEGAEVPSGAVRIEEMINYFDYDYKTCPEGDDKFSVYTEYSDCPWNDETKLLLVGINTADIDFEEKQPSNLVFLIDTSGSMYDDNKLPLARAAFKMLAENLDENDRVSIVTYAGSDMVVLSGEAGSNTYTITNALNELYAEGCTNGSDGILTAYEVAEKYFIEGGNNRIILATDGDLNVGLTSESDLVGLITEEKESGIFLSVLGFGTDNLKDNKLEALADYGNGNYAYIDSVYEAKKVLVEEMGGTLYTVAKDVKFQVEFNPENVKGYRLIGYENRALAASDFDDDSVDGGEIGAGHIVTAIYEVVPADSDFEISSSETKYSENTGTSGFSNELATINIRYKEPDEDTSKLVSKIVESSSYTEKMSADMSFVSAVAAFGMLLKDSDYSGTADMDMVLLLAEEGITDKNTESDKTEFIYLVNMAAYLMTNK